MVSGDWHTAAGDRNPFDSTPLARSIGPHTVTISTGPIRKAIDALETYLAGPPPAGRRSPPEESEATADGRVLVVTGEHGTGKSHLAYYLLQQARVKAPGRAHTFYLIAGNRTFLELYADLAVDLSARREEVREQVRAVYADIVAASLRGSPLTERVAQDLADGLVDPVAVVERLGLAENALLSVLRRRLEGVTDDGEFGTALTLLLRPALEPAVWEWFQGQTPDPTLHERGVTARIDTEERSLQAMGVFALLYGSVDHRFLLVLDEMEQILHASGRPGDAAMVAFKRLLEVFSRAGAFLLLAGLPEIYTALQEDVGQRLGLRIEMAPFTGTDVRRFIEQRQRVVNGTATLFPFTNDTVEHLVELANGKARPVLKICHDLYERAAAAGSAVTNAMVNEVVRTQLSVATPSRIRQEIRRALDASGWDYVVDHFVGRVTVDFWVRVGERSGCAVLLVDLVVNDGEAQRLRQRIEAIRVARPGSEAMVVVSGFMASTQAQLVAESLGRSPLLYSQESFPSDFEVAFKSVLEQLDEGTPRTDGPAETYQRQLERLVRQQENTNRVAGQSSERIDALRRSTDRQLAVIQRDVADIRTALAARTAPAPARSAAAASTPPPISGLFEEAESALGFLSQVDAVLRSLSNPSREATLRPLQARMRGEETQRAIGIGLQVRQLLQGFREEVDAWYLSVGGDSAILTDDERMRIRQACEHFDANYRNLPVHRLQGLTDLAVWAAEQRIAPPVRVRTAPPTVFEALDGLGNRVAQEVLATG